MSVVSLQFFQVFAQAYNLNPFISLKLQYSAIAGHDGASLAFECAFKNAVVRLIRQDVNFPLRFNELSDIGQEHSYARQLFLILPEFLRQHGECFKNNGFGENECDVSSVRGLVR
jgi:hypothetical protein